jgi:hypothetical protein
VAVPLRRTDAALYPAKQVGRARCVTALPGMETTPASAVSDTG